MPTNNNILNQYIGLADDLMARGSGDTIAMSPALIIENVIRLAV